MDLFRVNYSPSAVEDLRSIYNYIAFELQVPETAEKHINQIRNKAKSLSSFPKKHPIVDWEPWCSMGMRKLPINNYVIYYMEDKNNNEVIIVRILYSGRDVQSLISSSEL